MKRELIFTFCCLLTTLVWSQEYQRTETGIKASIFGKKIDVEVQWFNANSLRVLKMPHGQSVDKKSLSVIARPEKTALKVSTSEDGNIVMKSLLTEFTSGTNPDRQNFVKRNRIVAGMSDATVVIESAAKGGALITAELAESYHRDCFAFPGRCNDEYSIGCNNLIRKNQAVLITSAEDLVKAMGWESSPKTEKTVQRELFPDLSEEEERIVKRLGKMSEGLQINTLVIDTNIPVNRMSALLFELEMKGVIRALAGGVYRLIM